MVSSAEIVMKYRKTNKQKTLPINKLFKIISFSAKLFFSFTTGLSILIFFPTWECHFSGSKVVSPGQKAGLHPVRIVKKMWSNS